LAYLVIFSTRKLNKLVMRKAEENLEAKKKLKQEQDERKLIEDDESHSDVKKKASSNKILIGPLDMSDEVESQDQNALELLKEGGEQEKTEVAPEMSDENAE